jgi:hypothetical protein
MPVARGAKAPESSAARAIANACGLAALAAAGASPIPAEQAEALADKLTKGTWTHDYPIMAAQAKALGLPVSTDMPESVLELMTLYPQPVRTQSGGVEYLPVAQEQRGSQDMTALQ